MFDTIKKFFEFGAKVGFYFPAAYDAQSGKPSASLMFAHISFFLAVISVISLSIKDINLGTLAAMTLAGMYFVFYMLRKLNKAKIDLDDKSIDLANDEKES